MNFWLPLIGFIVFLWLWLTKRGTSAPQRGVLSFGKSQAREVKNETVTFDDIAGVDEATDELREIVDFLKRPGRYTELGARTPKGVLLVGPPGTGKTLLARAVAGEASVPFFQISGSDFVEMFVGVGASRVRDLFRKARENSPCIIFIDELDALGKARGSGIMSHEEREQTLNQLLVEMDGFDPSKGVIVLAATNRPEILDAALLRAGRFDRQVLVDRPEKDGRKKILQIHTRKVQLDPDIDLDVIAGRTPGFAGADLANLVNEAALLAGRSGKKTVSMNEFNEAIERTTVGLEKKGRLLTPAERKIVAYHELGHAVVAEKLPGADPVQKVSIIPRGMGLGLTWQRISEDRYLLKESELRDRIAVLLGGRAAEILFIGEPSTGAHDDLAKATDMAMDMVRKYGMSDLGLRTFERARTALVNQDFAAATPREHGEQTAEEIDREVRRIIDDELQRAKHLLDESQAAIHQLAERLLNVQQLEGKEIRDTLGLPERHSETASAAHPMKMIAMNTSTLSNAIVALLALFLCVGYGSMTSASPRQTDDPQLDVPLPPGMEETTPKKPETPSPSPSPSSTIPKPIASPPSTIASLETTPSSSRNNEPSRLLFGVYFNPLHIGLGFLDLSFEASFHARFTLQGQFVFIKPLWSSDLGGANIKAIGGGFRSFIFLMNRVRQGLYLSPFIQLVDLTADIKSANATATALGYAVGGTIGWGWHAMKHLMFRFGAGMQFVSLEAESKDSAGNTAKAGKRFPFPAVDVIVGAVF